MRERMMKSRLRSEGFTLIELLIVIIIIGILAAIAIPMFLSQRDKAKDAAVKGAVHNIELGLANWGVDHADTYPTGPVTKANLVEPRWRPVRRQLACESLDERGHDRPGRPGRLHVCRGHGVDHLQGHRPLVGERQLRRTLMRERP